MPTRSYTRVTKLGLLATLLAVMAIIGLASPTAAQNAETGTVEQQVLVPRDVEPRNSFGSSVAVDGDTLVIGDRYANSVFVYTRTNNTWTQQQALTADGLLGTSVDIDGDTIIAGAPFADSGAGTFGGAYVYTRTGNTWTQQQILTNSDAQAVDFY